MSGTRIEQWNERYRASEKTSDSPTPLVAQFTRDLPAGAVLDVACGTGRNALYLAERGWHVTAVDGSSVAIEILRRRSQERSVNVDSRIADLEADGFVFPDRTFDLVLCCLYLQRDLIPRMKSALRPGGLLIVIARLDDSDPPQGSPTRACRGELREFFDGWRLLHYREGTLGESTQHPALVEVVAQKPG